MTSAVDPDLFVRCKLSVGSAILERTKAGVELTPDRLAEARGCLLLAANAEAATPLTRAMARNSLGNLMREADDWAAAASEYLQASAEFEALSDWDSVAVGQVNAAVALGVSGRTADAISVARQALVTLEKAPRRREELAPQLAAVLGQAADYSHSEPIELHCPSCAQSFTGDLWLIIDVLARPDLYRQALMGSIHQLRCTHCPDGGVQVACPFWLLRLNAPVKLIASLPDGESPVDLTENLLTLLAARIGESWDPEWPRTATVRVEESELADELVNTWPDLIG